VTSTSRPPLPTAVACRCSRPGQPPPQPWPLAPVQAAQGWRQQHCRLQPPLDQALKPQDLFCSQPRRNPWRCAPSAVVNRCGLMAGASLAVALQLLQPTALRALLVASWPPPAAAASMGQRQ